MRLDQWNEEGGSGGGGPVVFLSRAWKRFGFLFQIKQKYKINENDGEIILTSLRYK